MKEWVVVATETVEELQQKLNMLESEGWQVAQVVTLRFQVGIVAYKEKGVSYG